ncbi:MAG TPA: MerR family DNA-binding transcriptional regulator [Vicinamibacteria bacterium]|nr:MerR family DNA-binding transcriptional regulator [Vicinamibacteria bacterium]
METVPGPLLSIGALSRAAGIPVQTLRTWETRYGFPSAVRRPSGHRVYPVSVVSHLRRIAEAIARGHRAGQVVGASEAELAALLQVAPGPLPGDPRHATAGDDLGSLLSAVEHFDGEALLRALLADWARLGPLVFLERRIAPLVTAIGQAWESGRLDIRHEHFLTERVGDLLRSLRLPFEDRASGPLAVLATLPGESHGLGLQMAALVLAAAGVQVLSLGTEIPASQVTAVCRDLNARLLALSVSSANGGAGTGARIRRLRKALPRRIALVVGGDGAPEPSPGVEVIRDLRALDARARSLWAAGVPGRAV